MEKRYKKGIVLCLILSVFLTFCGCETLITTPDNLLSPPELSGEMRPINEALAKSVTEEYKLCYPSGGNLRSPIVLEDVDGDGVKEAFAFYITDNGDGTNMHINFIKKTKKGWKSIADNIVTAGGIEKIEFSDISNDGQKEIIVGWEIFGSAQKELGIYSIMNGGLYERLMANYTNFVCTDISGDKVPELLLHYLDTEEERNTVSVYTLSPTGVSQTAGCTLDNKVKTSAEPIVSKLSNGKAAIFIDEEKANGNITEVLFMEDGELINPLLDKETGENITTNRSANIASSDIDNDGTIEIPIFIDAPAAAGTNEKFYFTNWCSFDGKELTVKKTTVINQIDGYYLDLPSKLIDKIAISRDTDKRTRSFYDYDKETNKVGKKMFTVTAISVAKYDNFAKSNKNTHVIYKDEENVFVTEIFVGGSKFSVHDISEMFNVIE